MRVGQIMDCSQIEIARAGGDGKKSAKVSLGDITLSGYSRKHGLKNLRVSFVFVNR